MNREKTLLVGAFVALSGSVLAAQRSDRLAPSAVEGIRVDDEFVVEVVAPQVDRPTSLAVDAEGFILMGSNCTSCPVKKIHPDSGALAANSSTLPDPDGVVVHESGAVFATSHTSITRTCTLEETPCASDTVAFGGFTNLNFLATVPNPGFPDDLFAIENDGRIYKMAAGTGAPMLFATLPGYAQFDPDPRFPGNLLASSDGAIHSIDAAGVVAELLVSDLENPTVAPAGPFGGDGRIYLRSPADGNVEVWDRDSGSTETTVFLTGLGSGAELYFESSETMLVTDFGVGPDSGRILRVRWRGPTIRRNAIPPVVLPVLVTRSLAPALLLAAGSRAQR